MATADHPSSLAVRSRAAAEAALDRRAAILDFCRRQPVGTIGMAIVLVLIFGFAGLTADGSRPTARPPTISPR